MTKDTTKIIRGFKDIYNDLEIKLLVDFETIISNISKQYGINELRPPILERTELFERSIGTDTEIGNKEMYSFEDKNSESISLRPEGTVTCVRCVIENNLIYDRGIKRKKYWYYGPMFRRERPQKGRFRQFNQFGIEYFGFDDINSDLEVIMFGNRLFKKELGIKDAKLHINSIGNAEDRKKYGDTIKSFLKKHTKILTEDQKKTLNRNPIRLLDTKSETLREILYELPNLIDMLSIKSRKRVEDLLEKLNQSNIEYILDNSIVRGLDYYNDTVFEWKHKSLGSQDAICAGGRYDSLVNKIGKIDVPAVGFAVGVERVLLVLRESYKNAKENNIVVIINYAKKDSVKCLMKTEKLRDQFNKIVFYSTNSSSTLDKQYKQAEKINPNYILYFGDEEVRSDKYTIKILKDGIKHEQISESELIEILKRINK